MFKIIGLLNMTEDLNCSNPTSDGQVSVLKCHPWIGIADTHNTRGFIAEFNHTLINYTECLKKSTYYNNMAKGHLNNLRKHQR